MARDTLTAKQEAFGLAYLETRSQREAYRRAYNADKMSNEAIDVEASKLMRHPKIAEMIRLGGERRQMIAEVKAMLTLEEHMKELEVLRDLAKGCNQMSAAITAEVKRGELRKFYVKQVEVGGAGEFEQMPSDDLDQFIFAEAKAILEADKPLRVATSKARH